MGCAPVKKHQPLEYKASQVGELRITIGGVYIEQSVKVETPNLKLRVSNQHFTTFNLPPASGLENKPGDTFTFIINSFYKPYGRSLQAAYCKDQKILFFGAFDLDTILEHKTLHEFKIFFSEKKTQKGHVIARGEFQPVPFLDLTFRFESATIRKKSGGLYSNDSQVAIRLTIGQQILQTEYQKDTSQSPPIWQDRKYNFKVPKTLRKGFLQMINKKEELLASCQLNLQKMVEVKEHEEMLQIQELFHREKQNKTVLADLKYSFIVGQKPNFLPRSEEFSKGVCGVRTQQETAITQERPHTN